MSSKVEAAKDATVSAAVQVKDAVVAAANYVNMLRKIKWLKQKMLCGSKAEGSKKCRFWNKRSICSRKKSNWKVKAMGKDYSN